jgi:hypothetical protein
VAKFSTRPAALPFSPLMWKGMPMTILPMCFLLHDAGDGALGFVVRVDRFEGARDDLGLVTEGETDAHGAVINGENARHED